MDDDDFRALIEIVQRAMPSRGKKKTKIDVSSARPLNYDIRHLAEKTGINTVQALALISKFGKDRATCLHEAKKLRGYQLRNVGEREPRMQTGLDFVSVGPLKKDESTAPQERSAKGAGCPA